jgi:hypothetical protein
MEIYVGIIIIMHYRLWLIKAVLNLAKFLGNRRLQALSRLIWDINRIDKAPTNSKLVPTTQDNTSVKIIQIQEKYPLPGTTKDHTVGSSYCTF